MKSQQQTIYHGLAEAFADEGVETLFVLMGTANMHWATAMKALPGMRVIYVRHEHGACAAAMGYQRAKGDVGVASVSCGPGFTHTITALVSAARNRTPLVLFAGESPIGSLWYEQWVDQYGLAKAAGVDYIPIHAAKLVHEAVREAFFLARTERKPVVLGVPYDLQKNDMPSIGPYRPSRTIIAPRPACIPNPDQLHQVAEELAKAKRPIIIAGRGVLLADAAGAVETLADKSGALLATTLAARGLYDHHPFSLGVAGGYSRDIAREMLGQADLVLAIGASISKHTTDGGRLFGQARTIQIANEWHGASEGRKQLANMYMPGDAKLASSALVELIPPLGAKPTVRSDELARRIKEEPADKTPFDIETGTVDPRRMHEVLEPLIPSDFEVVSGSGHYSYFHVPMRGGDPRRYHYMRGFGAIGNSLSYAIGVAVARGDGRVVLFEGDGGLSMWAQELETIRLNNLKLLVICANDGAYGSEIHKLRAQGIDDSGAVFGRQDFESVAKGFHLGGKTITDLGQFSTLMDEYLASDTAVVWNVHVSEAVTSPYMRTNIRSMTP